MPNRIAERVQARMNALNLNSAETSRRAGLGRTSVHDLISGRKQTIEAGALISLARALETTPEYLMGEDDVVARRAVGEIPVVGIAELGAWRSSDAPMVPRAVAVHESMADATAYLVRGNGAEAVGIHDSSIVIAVKRDVIKHGDVVVCRQRRDELVETSIRQAQITDIGMMLVAPTLGLKVAALPESAVEILGVVVRAIILFHSQII